MRARVIQTAGRNIVNGLNRVLRRLGVEIRPYRPVFPRLASEPPDESMPSDEARAARRDLVEANRSAWEQAADLHRVYTYESIIQVARSTGRIPVPDGKAALFEHMAARGKSVAQLCCNNGRELLAIKQAGAGRCTGFDLAEAFILQARELARTASLECEFVAGDVYDISSAYEEQYDRVLITAGALCCLPDLNGFFAVVARLLKPGGRLFMYEIHPFLNMFPLNYGEENMVLSRSYFRDGPRKDVRGLDYFGRAPTSDARPHYWFAHTLSDIFSGLTALGLRLQHFEESPRDTSSMYSYLNKVAVDVPLSYVLIAEKEVSS